jgi:hypothetical protein
MKFAGQNQDLILGHTIDETMFVIDAATPPSLELMAKQFRFPIPVNGSRIVSLIRRTRRLKSFGSSEAIKVKSRQASA